MVQLLCLTKQHLTYIVQLQDTDSTATREKIALAVLCEQLLKNSAIVVRERYGPSIMGQLLPLIKQHLKYIVQLPATASTATREKIALAVLC